MPNEVQNNKPKAVRSCFGLLTGQLNSVLLPYPEDGYRNTRRVNRCKVGLWAAGRELSLGTSRS